MAENTKISWADHTFNPWWGCTEVSPGCDHCYARTQAQRFKRAEWGAGKPRVPASVDMYRELFGANRRAGERGVIETVFMASMSDFFDGEAHPGDREVAWRALRTCENLVVLILTKRPANIVRMLPPFWSEIAHRVAIGVSAEDQQRANERIPVLLDAERWGDRARPTATFVSAEPLLGPVDLTRIGGDGFGHGRFDALNGLVYNNHGVDGDGRVEWSPARTDFRLGWVIAGGESGHGYRPLDLAWMRSLRDECASAGVPFWAKQDAGPRPEAPLPPDLQVREAPDWAALAAAGAPR